MQNKKQATMFFNRKLFQKKTNTNEKADNYVEKLKVNCITIGVSAGGMNAMLQILPSLPINFPVPIVIVQHLHPHQGNFHIQYYQKRCKLKVCEASEKSAVVAGGIYFAPANYHLVIENDKTFSLNIDRKINFSRPSIDCLFFSASDVYRDKLLGILLTGANNDGAKGMKYIQINGGLTIVQDPKDAEVSSMPMSAIEIMKPDWILPLNKIAEKLMNL